MIQSDTIVLLTGKFLIGTLFLIRILGFMVTAPLFKFDGVPAFMKILFAVILAVSLSSAFWYEQAVIDYHLWYLVFLVFKEFTMGAIMGFSANAIFWAARFAGGMIDFNLGFQASAVFANQDTPTMFGELKELMVLMVFLGINGHHLMIEGLFLSVRAVPIGTFQITESTFKLLTDMITNVTIIALKMSAPLLIAEFLTNMALALLARIAPQTNIFMLSFQIKIAVGFLVIMATISLFVLLSKHTLGGFQKEFYQFIMTLNPLRI